MWSWKECTIGSYILQARKSWLWHITGGRNGLIEGGNAGGQLDGRMVADELPYYLGKWIYGETNR